MFNSGVRSKIPRSDWMVGWGECQDYCSMLIVLHGAVMRDYTHRAPDELSVWPSASGYAQCSQSQKTPP